MVRYVREHNGSLEGPVLFIYDRETQAAISEDETLQAYRDYLAWLALGNTPDDEVLP